jgi:hypothetical protein
MNTQALIADIKADFTKYDDAGLIDENSLYKDIVKGLKRFGNDVMELHETVVQVKNGKAKLPDHFFSLYIAYLCEPLYYRVPKNVEVSNLQTSLYYKEKVILSNKWSECDGCCNEVQENIIRENLYFNGNQVEFYYHNPQLLRLGKTFNKNACHSACRNRLVRDNPNEIIINGTTLMANFEEGEIYMQYYGLPVDADGIVEIPETGTGHLETYLEYHLKRRLAERLMGNNDAQGLANLFNQYANQEQIFLRNASNELKMKSITPSLFRRIRRLNKLESISFDLGVNRLS